MEKRERRGPLQQSGEAMELQRYDAGPGGGRNGRGETSKKVVESGRDWQISEHDGSFRAYMEAKNQKLRIRYEIFSLQNIPGNPRSLGSQ